MRRLPPASRDHHFCTRVSTFRPKADNVVGGLDHVQVMLNQQQSVPGIHHKKADSYRVSGQPERIDVSWSNACPNRRPTAWNLSRAVPSGSA